MDSRLLNSFHDDPFDGNYVKFDTDTQFWSNDSGTLGLQLAETLHGILPIAPTEVISNSLFSNSITKEGDYFLENKHNLNTSSKMYENYDDVNSAEIMNNKQLLSKDSIKFGSVDREILEIRDEEEDDEEAFVSYDNVRSCSRSTFRSRTDSSSIGDYESHSSDYDDYSEEMDFETDTKDDMMNGTDINFCTKTNNDCTPNPPNDVKKSTDDIDSFAMQLDVNTFDLAAFITQDDQVFYNHSTVGTNTTQPINTQDPVKLTISSEIDSDSDVIVDVETVENDEIAVDSWCQGNTKDIQCLENIQQSPSKHKIEKKETKLIESNSSQFTNAPCNRQPVFTKRKFGIGMGKNINMHSNPSQVTPSTEEKSRSKQNINEEQTINVKKKREKSSAQTELIPKVENKTENTNTNKDSKVVKINSEKQNQRELVLDKNEPVVTKVEPKQIKKEFLEDVNVPSQTPKKRKLNLEEYKKRRENPSILASIVKNTNESPKNESSIRTEISKQPPKVQASKPSPNEAVTSIVKSLKENQSKPFVDPITEAKNKVLRLQELKKAQQIKIIDSTVSSKVARVTKLPPLKDIVKGCHKTAEKDVKFQNSEYEEIIIVSTSCNTDISIPPNGYNTVQQNPAMNSSRSLLKSNVLLANISSSFQKVRSDDSIKISTNSLIVSIQDVVVRKSSPLLLAASQEQTSVSSTSSAHGEDKIIMHLRKDRIRKRCVSKCTQTDLLPEFSVLALPRLQSSEHRFKSRRKTKQHRKYRDNQNQLSSDDETSSCRSQGNLRSSRSTSKYSHRRRSSISSSYSESEDCLKKTHRHSGSSGHSRGCSISSNEHRSRSESFDRIYNRKSRSRSKSSSRSMSKLRDANTHVDRTVSAPAVEERRIVYVGRIEQDTTKEMLRKKFISYGPIKQITIHYKDTGMKYGFVTYEKSEDAFRVIDSGQKDDKINMYDISFGGRRAFCRASYADLDNAGLNSCQSYDVHRKMPPPKEEDSFEALLLKVKAKLNASKSTVAKSKT